MTVVCFSLGASPLMAACRTKKSSYSTLVRLLLQLLLLLLLQLLLLQLLLLLLLQLLSLVVMW